MKETSKYNFHVNGIDEATINVREGVLPDPLPYLEPLQLAIRGTIDAPVAFLEKRLEDTKTWSQLSSHVLVDREKISIELVMNETDARENRTVKGVLELHPKFKEFRINSPENWEPNELGEFFKMNRAFFEDKQENMELVTNLKNFEANIDTKIEQQKEAAGSYKDNYSAIVQSNIPSAFKVNLPVFKGQSTETLEVEFYATVSGREVRLKLVSPGANQVLEEIRDKVIDEQVEKIKELAPHLVIIEK